MQKLHVHCYDSRFVDGTGGDSASFACLVFKSTHQYAHPCTRGGTLRQRCSLPSSWWGACSCLLCTLFITPPMRMQLLRMSLYIAMMPLPRSTARCAKRSFIPLKPHPRLRPRPHFTPGHGTSSLPRRLVRSLFSTTSSAAPRTPDRSHSRQECATPGALSAFRIRRRATTNPRLRE